MSGSAWAADTTTGSGDVVAIGTGTNAVANSNVAIGLNAVAEPIGGDTAGAVAIGNGATVKNTGAGVLTGKHGIAIGMTSQVAEQDGIAIGAEAQALKQNNVSVGYKAGNGSTGIYNFAFGSEAGQNLTGKENISIGRWANTNNTNDENIAIGLWTSYNGKEWSGNKIISDVYSKGHDVALGSSALQNAYSASNVAIGTRAGWSMNGAGNVILGTVAGSGAGMTPPRKRRW